MLALMYRFNFYIDGGMPSVVRNNQAKVCSKQAFACYDN